MGAPARVCVVVPTYNEVDNALPLLEAVKEVRIPDLALLFVDDSSPDGTTEVLRSAVARETWVRLIVRNAKLGIGSAYQAGFREAIDSLGASILVEMDADLQHPPAAIPALVRAINAGADVAVGSRYVPGGSVSGLSLWRRSVSKGANAFARTVLGLPVRDSTSGFRAYTRAAAEIVTGTVLPTKGFEFQVASLHFLKTRMKMVEVPYAFAARTAGKSKLGISDMARFFFVVIRVAMG